MDPGARRIERELPDRDAHSSDAEIPESEDPRVVGRDDDANAAVPPVRAQDPGEVAAMLGREVHPAGPAVDVAELLAGLADRGRVHDRRELVEVVEEEPVEEGLVPVLKRREEQVAMDVIGHLAVVLERPLLLFLRSRDGVREETLEAEGLALLTREAGAFVQERVLEKREPPHVHGDVLLSRHAVGSDLVARGSPRSVHADQSTTVSCRRAQRRSTSATKSSMISIVGLRNVSSAQCPSVRISHRSAGRARCLHVAQMSSRTAST